MKQLYYALQTMIRGRGSNIIKTISLTLGLFAGILLSAKIAFELNYNTDYDEPENLYIIMTDYIINGIKGGDPAIVPGPVPQTIHEAFPEIIENVTLFRKDGIHIFELGDKVFRQETVFADTAFFQTIGITVLQGNVHDLANPDMIFISEEFAKAAFGDENPVGKTLMADKTEEFIIRGVYRNVSENNLFRPDVVAPLQFIRNMGAPFEWYMGQIYTGLIRLRPGTDVKQINERIDAVIEPFQEYNPEKNGWGVRYSLAGIQQAHLKDPGLRMRLMIMFVLGFSLLLIAALNYVLISISSLASRAKGIGVHKCNGATTGDVFGMFLYETAAIIVVSLIFASLLIFSFKDLIEEILEASLAGLFVWEVMWVPALVVVFLFIIAGVLPGNLFSRIPVTQVFRRYSESKQGWKRPLLFAQFSGVAFIFGLLFIVIVQYRQVTGFDLGYQTEGMATAFHYSENREVTRATLANLPMVEDVAFSQSDIGQELPGDFVGDYGGKMLFSARNNYVDYNYVPLLGIKIKEGKNLDAPQQVLVNEEYVRLMHWTDGAVGKSPNAANCREAVIVGVMENFVDNSLFVGIQPVMFITGVERNLACITVRVKAPYKDNVKALNVAVKEAFPTSNIEFTYTPDRMTDKYQTTRRFRDMVLLVFASILLITLMGLLGYVNDEVQRRSKEIAIRKVNGAEASDILGLLSKGISWIALPAVIIGIFCSYFIGKEWLMQFERFQMDLTIIRFLMIAIAILVLIFGTVIIRSWHIANENPVNSIKNE